MRFYLTLFLFALKTALFCQNATVRGKISDADSGEPLLGVSVKATAQGGVSDVDGNYQISLPAGRHTLVFSYVGFEPKTENLTLAAGQNLVLDIRLGDSDNLLQTATVTSGKFDKPLGQVTVSLDVLKPGLIKSINATAVDQAIAKVPGVTILDGQAQIRGGSGFSYGAGTRVLLLVDDMPALQPDAGYPNWNDFPVENIAQIEVLKGAASALYGSSAMNGIINIRTGFAKDKPETEFAAWGKIWGTPANREAAWWKKDTSDVSQPFETGFNFLHKRKAGKLDLVLGGFTLERKSYNYGTYQRYGRLTPNFRFRVNDRLTLGLNTNFNLGRSGSFFIWQNDTSGMFLPGLNSLTFTKRRLRFTIDPNVSYTDRAGNRHKFLGRYYYIHNDNSNNQSNDSRNYYGEYQFQRNFENARLVLTSGLVGQKSTVSASLYGGDFTQKNLAGYLQLDWQPVKRLNLSGGVRYEDNTQLSPESVKVYNWETIQIPGGKVRESKPVMRFGANYQTGAATFWRASWGQGYRYPTIAEKFISTGFSAGNSVIPNPRLISETGWTSEIGLKQGLKIGSWKGYADLTFFWSEYENMMEFVLDTFLVSFNPAPPPLILSSAYFQSQNVGNTLVKGVEITLAGISRLGGGNLSLLTGYTYINPQYKDFVPRRDTLTSSSQDNVLKYRYKHVFKWDCEYELKGLALGLSYQYFSRMEAIDKVFQLPIVEPFGAVRRFRATHGGFGVLDLRLSYRVSKHLKVAVLGGNLMNTAYQFRPALMEAPRSFSLRVEARI